MNTSLTKRMKAGLGFVLSQSLIGNSCWLPAVCLLASVTPVLSGSWMSGPSLLTARDEFAGGVLNDKLIVFGGNGNPDGENMLSTELFDPALGSWFYKADNTHNGGEGVEELTGAVVNGKFYVFGACGSHGDFNFVEEYDPMKDTPMNDAWTTKKPMPTTRAVATAAVYNDKVYLFGGKYENALGAFVPYDVVEVYDPASDTWATETHMPTYLQSPAVAVVGNKAYVIGGAHGSYPNLRLVTDVSVYDFVTHKWSTSSCAPLPTPAGFSYSGAAPVKDGKIYLIGGFPKGAIPAGEANSNNWSTCFFIYDTGSNTWETGDPLPGGAVEYGFRAIIGGDLWVAGGDMVYNLNGSGEDLITGAVWKHSLTNIFVSPQPPRITKRYPVTNPAAINEGASVAFNATADDSADPQVAGRGMSNITWYVDGVLMQTTKTGAPGAITSAFTLKTTASTVVGESNRVVEVQVIALDKRGSSFATNWTVRVNNMPASQTITFKPLEERVLGTTNFSAGAAASSGLNVEYASGNPAVAEIAGGLIHVVGAGTAVITASQPGNSDFKAAAPVRQSLTVKARLATLVSGGTGTVSGAGLYLPGTKVALTARPAAGSTFLRWEDGSQAAARSYAMPNANATVSAWFAPTTNIPPPVVANPGAVRITVGVAFSLPLDVRSDSLPVVTVTGLPAGLSYSAATKSVTGVPKASVTNKPVSIKAVNVNKTPGTNTFFMTVDPLPVWAQGTYNGFAGTEALGGGLATLSVTPVGGVSGKITLRGTNFAISAASYSYREKKGAFCLATTANVSRVALPLTLYVSAPVITDTTGRVPQTLGKVDGDLGAHSEVLLYRNVWKDAGMAAAATNYTGYYTAVLPGGGDFGSGYLLLTVDKAGGVKATGKLADGTAVSLSGTLLLDEAGRALTALQAVPATYLGGSLFGLAEWVKPAAGGRLFVRAYAGSSFLWDSLNPQATGSYSAGFHRRLGLDGGWYDTLGNLRAYYTNGTLRVGTDGLPVPELLVGTNRYDSVRWDPCGITVSVVTNRGGVMTGLSAPKADVPAKAGTNGYNYASLTNAVGLTIGLTRATGVFKGAFNAWFDYPKTHTSRSIAYEGALTPEREDKEDGIAGRGFFLWADKSQYMNPQNKAVPYTFNWSYDLKILMPDMVFVQGGSLPDVGNGAVTAPSFYIGKREVTWAEWRAVRDWAAANGYDLGRVGAGSADKHPVQSVSWFDCVKWCNARSEMEGRAPAYYTDAGFTSVYKAGELDLFVNAAAGGYRLPTDAEWEFAARGGTQSRGYDYSGGNDLNAVGWYRDNSAGAAVNMWEGRGTWPVGAKAANELGLCDMSGNVCEWCFDWFPGSEGVYRVFRGGGWGDNEYYCRYASCSYYFPDSRGSMVGFRAVRTLP